MSKIPIIELQPKMIVRRRIRDLFKPRPTACTGTTSRGTLCTQTPVPGTDRCVFHKAKP